MHVREQIVRHVVESLSDGIPAAGGRGYAHGRVSWDRRTYPMVVVTGVKSRVDIEPGTGDRIERRETELVVEIHDLETDGEDYVERLGDLAVLAGRILADTPSELGVDTCLMTSDTGIVDIDEDERGVHAGTALTFMVSYFTKVGEADRMIIP